MHVLEFYTRKQRRVCRSTFSAELHALADAVESDKLRNLTLTEIFAPNITAQVLDKGERTGTLVFPIKACADAKNLFDAIAAADTKQPIESSLVSILLQLKKSLLTHSLKKLWWVDTRDMIADGLQKGSIGRAELLALGYEAQWKLCYDFIQHSERLSVPLPGNEDG